VPRSGTTEKASPSGLGIAIRKIRGLQARHFFGLQIEGTPCKVSFRNLWLKKLVKHWRVA
jgi:hypothetical protein